MGVPIWQRAQEWSLITGREREGGGGGSKTGGTGERIKVLFLRKGGTETFSDPQYFHFVSPSPRY